VAMAKLEEGLAQETGETQRREWDPDAPMESGKCANLPDNWASSACRPGLREGRKPKGKPAFAPVAKEAVGPGAKALLVVKHLWPRSAGSAPTELPQRSWERSALPTFDGLGVSGQVLSPTTGP